MDAFDNGTAIKEFTTYVQYSDNLINYRFVELHEYELMEIISYGSLIVCDFDIFLKACDKKNVNPKDIISKVFNLYHENELYENANAVKLSLEENENQFKKIEMGGRALKNTYTRRYNREEFDLVSEELINIIEQNFDRACIPLFYNNKSSFGDIDIIVDIKCVDGELFDGKYIRKFIENRFSPNEIFNNSNTWSFDYKEVQVDLICVVPEDFDSNYHYLGWNDLGNLIGRLAHRFSGESEI